MYLDRLFTSDGRQAGLGPVHLVRRADQHQGQRRRLADLDAADGRRDGAPHRLRADVERAGARIRERDGDEPLLPRPRRRQLPDQHLPPARNDLAGCALRAEPHPVVRGTQAAARAAQHRDGEARARDHRRRDRLGQVDHAGGDDRLPQQQPVRPHPDDRGSDRVPVRAQAAASSTSASSTSTPRATRRRWRTRCAKRPTSS